MNRKILTIGFWALGLVFCYLIYRSITGPIEFNKIKTERYTEVIKKLKDIRAAQNAYFKINGKYADNFDQLTDFIENAQFTITSVRDTSWTEFDKNFNIEVMRQGTRTDILGHVKVKDSLFKNDDRYKNLRYVPKKDVLRGLDQDLVSRELVKTSVEDVKGDKIKVGSLDELTDNGNWPTSYDAKIAKQ